MTDHKHTHTPLPWRINKRASSCVESASSRTIATTGAYSDGKDFDGSYNENIANAAFIVRACNAHYEMLEALENIVASVDKGHAVILMSLADAAKAAIAKAKE